ncbi:DUF4304 domain-containing protein [Rickettsiella grylli]|uniref:DUF4304 domain-containing protein n=1 Tax=Rickettsiella grylli TaxID=59196 RepID=A8PQH8_9COXI|nr:DUF4304 domain-containing protein [Rickettsiella grylli]EDP45819.1 hypothetical protein RICGR_1525 [Rickettsiella grylli]
MYSEIFNRLLKLMRPLMKQQGFILRGNSFYKRNPKKNIGIINFQRNREEFSKFTINVAIYSRVLAEFFLAEFKQKQVKEYPLFGDYHCQTRVGDLVPKENVYRKKDKKWLNGDDKWWHYDDKTDVDVMFQEISELIIEFAIPYIDSHITDQQLIELWFPLVRQGKKHLFKELSVLLLFNDEKEKLKIVMNKLAEYLEWRPELMGLKRHYDQLKKEMDKKLASN